jgi:hypothetical protein
MGIVTVAAYPIREDWCILEFAKRGWERVADGAAGIRAIKVCCHVSI